MTVVPLLNEATSKQVIQQLDKSLADLQSKGLISDKAVAFVKEFYAGQDRVVPGLQKLVTTLNALGARDNLDANLVKQKLDEIVSAPDSKDYGGGRVADAIGKFLDGAKSNVKGAGLVALPPVPKQDNP
jgi:hypothetical protein